MQTKDDLIRENTELRGRLELAERWMQREVQDAMQSIDKQWVKSRARKHFANLLEEEGIDIIARRIHETFGFSLECAPEFTLERLIDSEIYWYTLQKYPTMDGLPVILAYQKILDAWIKEKLIKGFRRSNTNIQIQKLASWDTLEKDIQNILTKNYTLSIGRLYQILSCIRDKRTLAPLVSGLVHFWKEKIPEILQVLISDEFFLPFSELMEREIFTKKRHEKKVTFSDVKKVREVMVQAFGSREWLFSVIFNINKY